MSTFFIPKLFQPTRVGTVDLQHRVVMAPMTRLRANAQHVHGSLALEYYRQRTTVPGTLAISEGTIIAEQAGGWKKTPGIWSDEQISGWSPVRRHLLSRRSRRVKPLFLPTYLSTPFYLPGRSWMRCTKTGRSSSSRSRRSGAPRPRMSFKKKAGTRSLRLAHSRFQPQTKPTRLLHPCHMR